VLAFLAAWLILSGTVALPGGFSMSQPDYRPSATGSALPAEKPPSETPPTAVAEPAVAMIRVEESGDRPAAPTVSGTQAVDEALPPAVVPEATRSRPLMIGGAIPLYTSPGQPDVQGFRPSAAAPSAPASSVLSYEELVQQARRSFWNGDFEAAERAYMDVIGRHPEDADVYGELGNLYVAMGRNALALDAYFEAGLRLKALGEQARLIEVVEILEKNGDDRGRQLGSSD